MCFRGIDPRDPDPLAAFQPERVAVGHPGHEAGIVAARCVGGRCHRYRRNEDGQRKGTKHGHDYRGAGGRLSSVIRTVPDLPHFACRPERTSLSAGLAGSAGPATASPTFFPGSVPPPSSPCKPPRFGRPPLCCGPAGAGPSSARLIDRLSRPHRAASHHLKEVIMAQIGSFTRGENGVYTGEIRTLTLRSEEHTSELQSLMRISYAVFCLKKKQKTTTE